MLIQLYDNCRIIKVFIISISIFTFLYKFLTSFISSSFLLLGCRCQSNSADLLSFRICIFVRLSSSPLHTHCYCYHYCYCCIKYIYLIVDRTSGTHYQKMYTRGSNLEQIEWKSEETLVQFFQNFPFDKQDHHHPPPFPS